MAHMELKVTAVKYTTREGDHPDDEMYLEQVKGIVEVRLADMGFLRAKIELVWAE